MEALRKKRTHISEIRAVRACIYFLACCLMILSIWKYAIQEKEYAVLIMNISSALIFIVLAEMSRHGYEHAFRLGIFLSLLILIVYYWSFKDIDELVTWDTLIFIAIDTLLRIADSMNKALKEADEILKKASEPPEIPKVKKYKKYY